MGIYRGRPPKSISENSEDFEAAAQLVLFEEFQFDIFAVRAVLTPGQDIHYGGTIPMLEDGALCVGPDVDCMPRRTSSSTRAGCRECRKSRTPSL